MSFARRVLLPCVAIAAIVGTAVWWRARPPLGFFVGVGVAPNGGLGFVTRHNPKNGDSRARVGLLNPKKGVVWSRELPAIPYTGYPNHGVVVAGQQVIVEVTDGSSYSQVIAYGLESGAKEWESEKRPLRSAPPPPTVSGNKPIVSDGQYIAAHNDGTNMTLSARDVRTGAVVWSLPLPQGPLRDVVASPTTLAYHIGSKWVFVWRQDGKVILELDAFSVACVAGNRWVAWSDDALISVSMDRPEVTAQRRTLPGSGVVRHCGQYGDELVYTVLTRSKQDATRELSLVSISEEAIGWTIGLGNADLEETSATQEDATPMGHPLRGVLADFVPIIVDSAETLSLTVLDLRRHTVAWRGRSSESLLHYRIVKGASGDHLMSNGSRLAVLRGADGEIAAAMELPHAELRRSQLGSDGLWIYDMRSYEARSWVVVDPASLVVLQYGSDEYQPTDALESFRDEFGAVP